MSFFCKVDHSIPGSVLRQVASAQLNPTSWRAGGRLCTQRTTQRAIDRQKANDFAAVERWFIAALADASRCANHNFHNVWSLWAEPPLRYRKPRPEGQRWLSAGARKRLQFGMPPLVVKSTSIKELVDLVDAPVEEVLPAYIKDPLEPPPGPHVQVSERLEDLQWPPKNQVHSVDGEAAKALEEMDRALQDVGADPVQVYKLYRALPAPRVTCLRHGLRHRLLRCLGSPERKDEPSMMRYLSVVDDMKYSAIALKNTEWNMAMSFATRYVARTTEAEVEAALGIFREMEQTWNVSANAATFNILFDAATKAGKFKLGEMIYKEMDRRNLPFNRFHHVSMIHYQGLRGDGESVRRAYKALIAGGEVVDSTVLNCMISSLIRAGEPQPALDIYERMKKLHNAKSNAPLPSRDYFKRRTVTKALTHMARAGKHDPIRLDLFRNEAIIAPDYRTYRILVNYTAVAAGDLHNTARYLDEMRWYEVEPHGSIFLAVFKGFYLHGNVQYTHWTSVRLEGTWRAFNRALEKGKSDQLYMGKWVIIWALKAFGKCYGKTRAEQIWEGVKPKWTDALEEELDHVRDTLAGIPQKEIGVFEEPDIDVAAALALLE